MTLTARHNPESCRWTLPAVTLLVASVVLFASGCGPVKGSGQSRPGSSTQSSSTAVPPALAGVVNPLATGAYIGVYQPPAPFDMSALGNYTSLSVKPPAILMWYQPWALSGPNQFDPAAALSVYEQHAVPMITWEPWNPGTDANLLKQPAEQPGYRLSSIISGKFDPYIHSFARGVKSTRGPIMIRPMHEMNGNWYPWSGTANGNQPGQFVTAWRHVHDIFQAEGATNVTWVWSINHESVPNTLSNRFAAYYPGDQYVDWVSISGFNWGSSSPTTTWEPWEFWYRRPLAYLETTGKPIVISEFGSVEEGGDKGAWITDAYTRIRTQHPAVKAIVYYNKLEHQGGLTQDWRIDTSGFSVDAYRAAVGDPYFAAGPVPGLADWIGSLTAANWAYLRSLRPVY